MFKLSVVLLLLALAVNTSAKPWYHQVQRFGNVRLETSFVETELISDSSNPSERPDQTSIQEGNESSGSDDDNNSDITAEQENDIDIDDYNDSEDNEEPEDNGQENEDNEEDHENDINDSDDHEHDDISVEEDVEPENESDEDSDSEIDSLIIDYEQGEYEPEPDISESDLPDEDEYRGKDLLKYVYESFKRHIMDSADPEIRDEIQKIYDTYPEPDFSHGEQVERVIESIQKEVKELKKSRGMKTSSEETDESSEDDVIDPKRELLKYAFESLKKHILNSADPEIHDEIQEIFDKYPEPDYSDGEKVEETLSKIEKDVKELKKSRGLKTSSEEEDSSSIETGDSVISSTTPAEEEEENEIDDTDSEEDDESQDDRRRELMKYVFQSMKEDILNSADPKIHQEIQKIFDKYPDPDFSNGNEVEDILEKIYKDVKELKESRGLETSSEEEHSSSIEEDPSNISTASITGTPSSSYTTPAQEESNEIDDETEEDDESDESENDESDRNKELFKYIFQSLTKHILNSADPEIRDEIQEIFDKYATPDFSDGEKVEQVLEKIEKDVKALKKSKGLKTSSEEDSSSIETGGSTIISITPIQEESNDIDNSGIEDDDVNTEKPDHGEDSERNKRLYQAIKEEILNTTDPEIHEEIQKIFNKYPEPDFSDEEEISTVLQKIGEDVKALIRSRELINSSEEDDTSSIQVPYNQTAVAGKEQDSENNEEDEESNGITNEENNNVNDEQKGFFKYMFRNLKEYMLKDADPEDRHKIQEILDKYPERDFSSGEQVKEVLREIEAEVKAYKTSRGAKISDEEDASEFDIYRN